MTNEVLLIVLALYGPAYVLPLPSTPKPAIVPAVCEPRPLQSSGLGSGCGVRFALPLGQPAVARPPASWPLTSGMPSPGATSILNVFVAKTALTPPTDESFHASRCGSATAMPL